MLVYEKRRKEPLRIVLPDDFAQQLQSIKSTKEQIAQLTHLCPELNPQKVLIAPWNDKDITKPKLKIQYDNQEKEFYTEVNFNSVQRFVPHHIYNVRSITLFNCIDGT